MRHIGENVRLGADVRIWHFTYIGDEVEIGDGTSIGSLAHIDRSVKIGSNCRIQGMVYLPPETVIGDNVFLGPGVILTNDPYPPSGKLSGITIEGNAVICAGVIIRPGVTIREGAIVGMGAIVTKDVETRTVVYGTPATHQYDLDSYLKHQAEWVNHRKLSVEP